MVTPGEGLRASPRRGRTGTAPAAAGETHTRRDSHNSRSCVVVLFGEFCFLVEIGFGLVFFWIISSMRRKKMMMKEKEKHILLPL